MVSCTDIGINLNTFERITQPIFVLLEDQANTASSEKHIEANFLFFK